MVTGAQRASSIEDRVKCNTAHGIHLSHWPEETKQFLITVFQKMPQKSVPKTLEPFPDGFFEEVNFNLL